MMTTYSDSPDLQAGLLVTVVTHQSPACKSDSDHADSLELQAELVVTVWWLTRAVQAGVVVI